MSYLQADTNAHVLAHCCTQQEKQEAPPSRQNLQPNEIFNDSAANDFPTPSASSVPTRRNVPLQIPTYLSTKMEAGPPRARRPKIRQHADLCDARQTCPFHLQHHHDDAIKIDAQDPALSANTGPTLEDVDDSKNKRMTQRHATISNHFRWLCIKQRARKEASTQVSQGHDLTSQSETRRKRTRARRLTMVRATGTEEQRTDHCQPQGWLLPTPKIMWRQQGRSSWEDQHFSGQIAEARPVCCKAIYLPGQFHQDICSGVLLYSSNQDTVLNPTYSYFNDIPKKYQGPSVEQPNGAELKFSTSVSPLNLPKPISRHPWCRLDGCNGNQQDFHHISSPVGSTTWESWLKKRGFLSAATDLAGRNSQRSDDYWVSNRDIRSDSGTENRHLPADNRRSQHQPVHVSLTSTPTNQGVAICPSNQTCRGRQLERQWRHRQQSTS